MAKSTPNPHAHLSFTLRVELPLKDSKKSSPLKSDHGDDFRFHLDLNPDQFIFDWDSNTQIGRVGDALERIGDYLEYIKALAKKRGHSPERIVKVNYKRNSPALGNVSFNAAVNGDMEPPAKPSKPQG